MALATVRLGYKDAAWFAANPTLVLEEGQHVYLLQTGQFKLGDGTTQLSSLSFLGGSGFSAFTYTTKDITGLTDIDLSGLSGTIQVILTSSNSTETIESFTNIDNVDRIYLCPQSGLTVTVNDKSVSGQNIRLFSTPLTLIGDDDSFISLYKKNVLFYQEAFIDQYVSLPVSAGYLTKYTQILSDSGYTWRDGGRLIPISGSLLHFNGWNPGAFVGNDSTTEVIQTANGSSFSVASFSPTSWGARHAFGLAKLPNGKWLIIGGDHNDLVGGKEIWQFDPTNLSSPYSLINSDWGIGGLLVFEVQIDQTTGDIFIFGGQELLDPPYNVNLNVYRSTNGGTSFSVFGTLPAGAYSAACSAQDANYIYLLGGANYDEPPFNFNDKILRINKSTGSVSQLGVLSNDMLSNYPTLVTLTGGKYMYIKGVDTTNANDTGVWITDDFITWYDQSKPYVYRQQIPSASHARPAVEYNGEVYGNFGNFVNDSWKIEVMNAPTFTLSPYLVQWYTGISSANRPVAEPTAENALMNIIGPYCDFAAVSTLSNTEQRLMPLMTTSGLAMTNMGATIGFDGYTPGSGGYIIDNFNPATNNLYTATDNIMELVYITAQPGTGVAFGALTTINNGSYLWPNDSGTMYASLNSQNESNTTTASTTGLKGIRRTNGTQIDFIDGTTITTKSQLSTGVASFSRHILGFNYNNGTNAQNPTGMKIAGRFTIKGDADFTTIYNAITSYFASKGL